MCYMFSPDVNKSIDIFLILHIHPSFCDTVLYVSLMDQTLFGIDFVDTHFAFCVKLSKY